MLLPFGVPRRADVGWRPPATVPGWSAAEDAEVHGPLDAYATRRTTSYYPVTEAGLSRAGLRSPATLPPA